MTAPNSRAAAHSRALPKRRRGVWALLLLWRSVWRERQALARLTEHELRDVGLTRDHVRDEIRRPPWDIERRW